MLILAGGGMSIAGALVVYGALTGRLAAMLAAVFKPDDLAEGFGGYTVRPGAVDPLGTVLNPPVPGSQQPAGLGGFFDQLTGVPNSTAGASNSTDPNRNARSRQ